MNNLLSFTLTILTVSSILLILSGSCNRNIPEKDKDTTNKEEASDENIFYKVEEMPEYPGGQKALQEYLATIEYPQKAQNKGIEGEVYVSFVIDKDGSVINPGIARETGTLLDTVALEHVKKMPAWEPGYQRGERVKVKYVVPLRFKLNDDEEESDEKDDE